MIINLILTFSFFRLNSNAGHRRELSYCCPMLLAEFMIILVHLAATSNPLDFSIWRKSDRLSNNKWYSECL